jgi:hypothetical protein
VARLLSEAEFLDAFGRPKNRLPTILTKRADSADKA